MFNAMGNANKKEESFDVIPAGTRLWAHLAVKEIKTSQNSGRRYLNLELTVMPEQPYANRKIFDMIMDPSCPDLVNAATNGAGEVQSKAQTTINMSIAALGAILEGASNGPKANPQQPDLYNISEGYPELRRDLIVPISVKVEKDKSGQYDPKNRVKNWLSPNPNRRGHDDYNKLLSGDHGGTAQTPQPGAAPQTGFPPTTATAQPAAAPATAQPAAQAAAPAAAPQANPFGGGAPAAGQPAGGGWPGSS